MESEPFHKKVRRKNIGEFMTDEERMVEIKEEPWQVPKDYTNGFHYTQEDLAEKRSEIYDQMNYLMNCLKQIDLAHEAGDDVMSTEEVREYLKLDSIDERMSVPKDIPKIKLGTGYVYYRKDVKRFLDSRRRGGAKELR